MIYGIRKTSVVSFRTWGEVRGDIFNLLIPASSGNKGRCAINLAFLLWTQRKGSLDDSRTISQTIRVCFDV